jgi:hypothetical protein
MHFRDLTPSKAERSSAALFTAARVAEHSKTWNTAAEFYEAAAQLWPTGFGHSRAGDIHRLLRRADLCRSMAEAKDELDEKEFLSCE